MDLQAEMEKVVVRATHCPHYLTYSYVQWYGKEMCGGCFMKLPKPSQRVPKQRKP